MQDSLLYDSCRKRTGVVDNQESFEQLNANVGFVDYSLLFQSKVTRKV